MVDACTLQTGSQPSPMGDSLRIPPGPQKGLPSSAVVIGDTYDNKFLDHMLLIMTSPLSFFTICF